MSDRSVVVLVLVDTWKKRLLISERVQVELVADDGEGQREKWSRCYPVEKETESLWSFILEVYDSCPDAELERVVVHELVHLVMEPLRPAYFDGGFLATGNGSTDQDLERWETVIDHLTEAYLSQAAVEEAEGRIIGYGGREFSPP